MMWLAVVILVLIAVGVLLEVLARNASKSMTDWQDDAYDDN